MPPARPVDAAATRATALVDRVARRFAPMELRHDVADAVLVLSTGRSGSTWISQALAGRRLRYVFEPFRRDEVPEAAPFRWGQWLDPADDTAGYDRAAARILAGHVSGPWVDQWNRRPLARRRLIKEIRATALLPWLRARFPDVPVVYLVRHPLAVARSWAGLGWPHRLEEALAQPGLMARHADQRRLVEAAAGDGDLFVGAVVRWCLENVGTLASPELDGCCTLLYEDAVRDPAAALGRAAAHVGIRPRPGWLAGIDVPSPTSWLPKADPGGWLADVDADRARRGLDVLHAFGVTLYGEGPEPQRGG